MTVSATITAVELLPSFDVRVSVEVSDKGGRTSSFDFIVPADCPEDVLLKHIYLKALPIVDLLSVQASYDEATAGGKVPFTGLIGSVIQVT